LALVDSQPSCSAKLLLLLIIIIVLAVPLLRVSSRLLVGRLLIVTPLVDITTIL